MTEGHGKSSIAPLFQSRAINIPLGTNIFAPTFEQGILSMWINFTPGGKCIYMTSLPLGIYLLIGFNLPLGQTYAYKRA